MYSKLAELFSVMLLIGTFLTLSLYQFDLVALKKSTLDQKIIMWIPLAALFLLILYIGSTVRAFIFVGILGTACYEWIQVVKNQKKRGAFVLYIVFILVALGHLGLLYEEFPTALILLTFIVVGTVASDVAGFFAGRFFGSHKLPSILNPNKSWEGVFGQLIGALIGVLLVRYVVALQGNILIFLPIGLGSALGDLANSRIKRLAGIDNWANTIPGHGGFIDRFCSLSGSSLLSFYFLLLLR